MSKTILVTGANRGIGFELVKQYAKLNYTVFACCRDPNHAMELEKLSNHYQSIRIMQLDVSNRDQIKQIAEELKKEEIDILFNNAGIAGEDNLFGEITDTDLLATFSVNTIGPVLLIQALHKLVANSKKKIIVNTSSALSSIELNQDTS